MLRHSAPALNHAAGSRQAIEDAVRSYRNGERSRAEELCRAILTLEPKHFDALNLLGIIAAQTHRASEAADLLGRATAARPQDAAVHNNYGNVLRQLRRFADALASYERALKINPNHAEAHYNRGLALHDLRHLEQALDSYDRALAIKPAHADALNSRGNALRDLRRAEDALASYECALLVRPDHAETHVNRGVILQELGRVEEALASYGRALAIKPDYAEALYNCGNALRSVKRLHDALSCYERAIDARPDYPEAHNSCGVTLRELGRLEEALQSYARAVQLKADYAEAIYNRGVTLQDLKRFEEALGSYERALEVKADFAEAHNNRGNVLRELRRSDGALQSYARALAARPDYAAAYSNHANVLRDLGRHPEALAGYEQALVLEPEQVELHNNRGITLQDLGRFEEALESYRRALSLQPQHPWLYGTYLQTKMQLCEWRELDAELARLEEQLARGVPAAPPFSVLVLKDSPALQHRAAQIWVKQRCGGIAELPAIAKRPPGARIRLGYYSADFHNHATAYLAAQLFEQHDRERFEVYGFSFGAQQHDEMSRRVGEGFDQLLQVRERSDRHIAELSRELAIDIAVDLKGFTREARTEIFAYRAAPVQVSYLGYPGSSAAPYMDYLIADRILIPEAAREHYSEKIIYLPHSYQVNDRQRRIAQRHFTRAELGLPEQGFVFCCFNNTFKITPEVFGSWMRLLAQLPHSILWLLSDSPTAAQNLRHQAHLQGINPERLVFAQRMPLAEHLARHRAADLFLDTLPCNAHTTASDALWAGVPVLTRIGESFPARVGASLLSAVGLAQLITTSPEQYEATALALARDPERLAQLKAHLHAHRLSAPLFDSALITRHLENAFAHIYQRYHHHRAPEHVLL